jgi:L-ascorbate metabolism protein UlaG (beta-lactamase superfamily)
MAQTEDLVLSGRTARSALRRGSVLFIGTATTLIRYAGFTILTDPNFLHRHQHAHLGAGLLRTRRLTEPALQIADLPPLDLVLLSHFHEDHFDRVAARELPKDVPILTTHEAARKLRRAGFTATYPLRRWEARTIRKGGVRLTITAMPGRHGPGILAAALPDVNGSLLDFTGPSGNRLLRLYITGDTLIHRRLHEIPKRFPDIDIALLHLGGTRVLGILVTMDAKQGVEALRIIKPKVAIPIHYNDYTIFRSPLSDFQRAVRVAGLDAVVRYLSHGDSYGFEIPRGRWE